MDTDDARVESLQPIAREIRRRFPHAEAVYVFGRFASRSATSASDVDLAVLAPTPLDPQARFEAQRELAVVLGRDVDLIDLARASTVLRQDRNTPMP